MAGAAAWALAGAASGQIEVGCRLETSRVLLFEPIRAAIRVANHTGRPLRFTGPNPDARLDFVVEQAPGVPVLRTDRPILELTSDVPTGEEREWKANLLPAYAIRSTGPYTVQARVTRGEQAFLSPKAFLDVLPGLDAGRLAVGISGAARETRVYTLKTMTRDRMELLFLCVDDEGARRSLGVFNLGRIVRQFRPQIQSDARDHVHVLHQSSPWKFTHTEINPDGIPVSSRDFTAVGPEARLEKDAEGAVVVRGIRPPQDPALFQREPTTMPAPARGKKRR